MTNLIILDVSKAYVFFFSKQKKPVLTDGYTPLEADIVRDYNHYRPLGPQEHICYVPFSSLTFSWMGKVYACSYNRQIVVGHYPEDSLHDIWFGERLKKLQTHLQHDDLTHGCQHCAYFLEHRKFSGIKPLLFDQYADYKKHLYPRVFEFELSNKCNLECIMCNGYASSSIRQNREKLPPLPEPYDDAFVEQLREFIPHLKEIKFFGGEPFLIRSYFGIMDLVMELNPAINIFVITNGTVLTDKVKNLLDRGDFNLAVSIDSIRKETYEYIRKNASYEEVMSNLDYFNEYARARGKRISLSFTTQRANWDELPEVIAFCNRKGIVFYNSFLKSPENLSLITLPSQELRKIYDTLQLAQLPETNELEVANKRCYTDYLNYILPYIEGNRGMEEAGKTIASDAPLTDSPLSDIFIYEEDNDGVTSTVISKEELFDKIKLHYASGNDATGVQLIQKLEFLFSQLNSPAIEQRIINDIAKSSVPQIARNVLTITDTQLVDSVREVYKDSLTA